MIRALIVGLLVGATGCGGETASPDASFSRRIELEAVVATDGFSEPLPFVVPTDTRSDAMRSDVAPGMTL